MSDQPPEFMSFPTDPQDFNTDDRISFSKTDKKFIAVQEDGQEYEFDHQLGRWKPLVDEEEIDTWASAYNAQPARGGEKRKADHEDDHSNGRSSKQAKKNKQQKPRQNTAVYVTGLPLDTTVEEVQELFQRKCGVIAEEIDSGRPRIKLYTDSEGKFKGDALIVFFKPESVEMAIMLLDDTDFRFGSSDQTKMHVQEADSSYKKTKYPGQDKNATDSETKGATTSSGGGGGGQGRADARSRDDKAKVIRKTQKLDAKLADWDDEPSTALPLPPLKTSRIVILQHMFTLEELKQDPTAILEIKEDIRDECSKLGTVTNVVLYDLEEDGIVRVKFKEVEAAERCIQTLHGRMFGGQVVEAYYAAGKEKFRKSKSADDEHDGDDSD
ncbi:hypothetical protein V8F33_007774 [Rhypophila sp. PSN 637]